MTATTLPRSRTQAGTGYVDRGAGEAIVFVHGVGMNADAWAPQLAQFHASYRTVAVDLLGHGVSRPPEGEARLDSYVDQLMEFADALGLDRVNVVGHSMGGLVALGFALRAPDRLLRLAALNTVYDRPPKARQAVEARAAAIATQPGAADTDGALERWFGPEESRDAANAEAATRVRAWLEAVPYGGYAAAYGVFSRADRAFEGRLAEIAAPTLFLTGSDDPNSTPDMSRRMAREVRTGRAVCLSGARHMPNIVQADAVNHELSALLAESPARPRAAPERGDPSERAS